MLAPAVPAVGRAEGKKVDEVVTATGWQRHTVPAVFSGAGVAHHLGTDLD
jgi:hypothetical protein